MANLSIRHLDDATVWRLRARASREGTSLQETVRRVLHEALVDEEPVGAMIRRIVGEEGIDLELPERELETPADFGR